jgi:hypothetical protein
MLDPAFGTDADADAAGFRAQARSRAERLAYDPALDRRLEEKRRGRATDEQVKPLRAYRREERAQSHRSFFGPDRGYHDARVASPTSSEPPAGQARGRSSRTRWRPPGRGGRVGRGAIRSLAGSRA